MAAVHRVLFLAPALVVGLMFGILSGLDVFKDLPAGSTVLSLTFLFSGNLRGCCGCGALLSFSLLFLSELELLVVLFLEFQLFLSLLIGESLLFLLMLLVQFGLVDLYTAAGFSNARWDAWPFGLDTGAINHDVTALY